MRAGRHNNSDSSATTLRFRDSREVPWSGSALAIENWSSTTNGNGPDHIFVGTNAQALTTAQLGQITFVNPFGLPPGNYPAKILATGEIVPLVLPAIDFTRTANALILTWNAGFELLSATNVTGPYVPVPGATSPYTNFFTEPQRYFRLRDNAFVVPWAVRCV